MEQRVGGRANLIKLVANPALTGFTAPKILWLRNHEPRHFDKTRKVLLPKDEIRRRLTGEYATEVSDASGMLLLDVARRTWSKPLLSALELDVDLLAALLRIGGSDRPAHAAGGRGPGADDRLRRGGRGGRLRRRGGRQRHRRQGRPLHLDRHLRRDVRPLRRGEDRSRWAASTPSATPCAASGT